MFFNTIDCAFFNTADCMLFNIVRIFYNFSKIIWGFIYSVQGLALHTREATVELKHWSTILQVQHLYTQYNRLWFSTIGSSVHGLHYMQKNPQNFHCKTVCSSLLLEFEKVIQIISFHFWNDHHTFLWTFSKAHETHTASLELEWQLTQPAFYHVPSLDGPELVFRLSMKSPLTWEIQEIMLWHQSLMQ